MMHNIGHFMHSHFNKNLP